MSGRSRKRKHSATTSEFPQGTAKPSKHDLKSASEDEETPQQETPSGRPSRNRRKSAKLAEAEGHARTASEPQRLGVISLHHTKGGRKDAEDSWTITSAPARPRAKAGPSETPKEEEEEEGDGEEEEDPEAEAGKLLHVVSKGRRPQTIKIKPLPRPEPAPEPAAGRGRPAKRSHQRDPLPKPQEDGAASVLVKEESALRLKLILSPKERHRPSLPEVEASDDRAGPEDKKPSGKDKGKGRQQAPKDKPAPEAPKRKRAAEAEPERPDPGKGAKRRKTSAGEAPKPPLNSSDIAAKPASSSDVGKPPKAPRGPKGDEPARGSGDSKSTDKQRKKKSKSSGNSSSNSNGDDSAKPAAGYNLLSSDEPFQELIIDESASTTTAAKKPKSNKAEKKKKQQQSQTQQATTPGAEEVSSSTSSSSSSQKVKKPKTKEATKKSRAKFITTGGGGGGGGGGASVKKPGRSVGLDPVTASHMFGQFDSPVLASGSLPSPLPPPSFSPPGHSLDDESFFMAGSEVTESSSSPPPPSLLLQPELAGLKGFLPVDSAAPQPASRKKAKKESRKSGKKSDRDKKKKKKKTKAKKAAVKEKKPLTAYMLWCRQTRRSVVAQYPGLDFSGISRMMGTLWQQLPEKEKMAWYSKQRLQNVKHKNVPSLSKQKHRPSHGSGRDSAGGGGRAGSSPRGSPARPFAARTAPIDSAAHLKLLGESLSLVGDRLQNHVGQMEVHGSLSVLLDSTLCALAPLMSLTSQVPQLNSISKETVATTLDNIAYIMPGLG